MPDKHSRENYLDQNELSVPQSLHNLYDVNYNKIIQHISNDLERWSSLPLSLLGRVESIRMNVLPRLLYLFQMLPVEIPKRTLLQKKWRTGPKLLLKIWNKIRSAFGLPNVLSSLTNIGLMKTFTPNNLDSGFRKWSDHGLNYLHQLVKDDNLKTFTQLKNEFDLPRTDFFRYLQLRSFLMTHKDWGKLIRSTPIEKFLISQISHGDKKIISKLYNIFLLINVHNSEHIRLRWEAEMNKNISLDTWKEICTEAHLATNSNTWKEFKWKVTRFFRTPAITSKMGPALGSSCWRNCGNENANHTHIFWLCPKLSCIGLDWIGCF